MMTFVILWLFASAQPATPRPEPGGGPPFALLELFTSEGCSSCPPADELLSRVATEARASGKHVLTMELHVDYWNSLGWKDPFSSADYSRRQREYANAFGEVQIYTPQLVVNGTQQCVGSDRRRVEAAIQAALGRAPAVFLRTRLAPANGGVRVDWELSTARHGALLYVALVDSSETMAVDAGENAGNTLEHTNVVRLLVATPLTDQRRGSTVLPWTRSAANPAIHVITFVQDPRSRAILGAAEN